jgi:hypothetical protein
VDDMEIGTINIISNVYKNCRELIFLITII